MISVGIEDLTNIPALGYRRDGRRSFWAGPYRQTTPKSNRVKPCMAMHFNKLNM